MSADTPPTSLPDLRRRRAVLDAVAKLSEVERYAADLADLAGVADALRELADVRDNLAAVEATVQTRALALHPGDTVTLADGRRLIRRPGGRRVEWDSPAIVARVAALAAAAPCDEDGEAYDAEAVAVRAVEMLAECGGLLVPSAGWRARALAGYGIEASEHSRWERGPARIELL